ncbi:MAG TPA: glycosyltransferase family 87 protein, partial [Chloroflexota bacterium]|nr:glycosyltransferase family 87 protein [Chloroflexota bacterium]
MADEVRGTATTVPVVADGARSGGSRVTPARARMLRGIQALRVVVFVILAVVAFAPPLWQLQGYQVYNTALKADYLRAQALRDGQDIFGSIDALADRYFPVRGNPFEDPSPHPPVLALLFVPATYLPFPLLCALWLALNVALLLLVGRWLGFSPLATLALGAWPPLFLALKSFQWEVILLALVMACWRDAERGRDSRAGLWLGVAGVIKFYPFLLVLPFLMQRRFRTVGAAMFVLAVGQVGSMVAVGPGGLWRYYTVVLPHLGVQEYAGSLIDTSVHGALLRLLPDSVGVALVLTGCVSLIAIAALARVRLDAGPVAVMLILPTYVLSKYLTL